MLNRDLEAMYWFARTMERACRLARWLKCYEHHLPESHSQEVFLAPEQFLLSKEDRACYGRVCRDMHASRMIPFLTDCQHNPNAIFSCLAQAKQHLRKMAYLLPEVVVESFHEMHVQALEWLSSKKKSASVYALCTLLERSYYTLGGLFSQLVERNALWDFWYLGQLIEHIQGNGAFYLYQMVPAQYSPLSREHLQYLLAQSGVETHYRQEYRIPNTVCVFDFLIFSQTTPQGLHFSWQQLEVILEDLSQYFDLPVGVEQLLWSMHECVKSHLGERNHIQALLQMTQGFMSHSAQCHQLLEKQFFHPHIPAFRRNGVAQTFLFND